MAIISKLKFFNFCIELYLNSNKLVKGLNNSVYDLIVYRNQLIIPDYRNNFILYYNLNTKKICNKIIIKSPHGLNKYNNSLIVSTYKQNKIIFIQGKNIKNSIELKNYFPLNFIQKKERKILCDWSQANSYSLLFLDQRNRKLQSFEKDNLDDKPHNIINFKNKFYAASHSIQDPKLIIYNLDGKIINIIRNKYINDPVSIKIYKKFFYVCDYNSNSVVVLDSKFNVINILDKYLLYPMNTTFYKNKMFICEEKSNRILSFELNYG